MLKAGESTGRDSRRPFRDFLSIYGVVFLLTVAGFVASEQATYITRLLLSDGIHLRHDLPPTDITMLAGVASLTAKSRLHPTLALLLDQARQQAAG